MSDLEYEDIQELLSTPAAAIPGQVTRRRFLQGAAASAGALSVLPSFFDPLAASAVPLGPDEGVLVVIQMGGGNDGLNMLPPRDDAAYRSLRGSLAITDPLPITSGFGFHPALVKLKGRYDAGQVAVVQGIGQTGNDRSHFSSTATWMAGTATTSRSSGWLGRWLDGVPEATEGLRGVTMGSSIPLHLTGQQAVITALDTGGQLFGADRSDPAFAAAYDTVAAYADAPTGKGQWADALAASGATALGLSGQLDPLFNPPLGGDDLVAQLTLAARLVNADLGIRVLNSSFGSFDTHENQLVRQQALLVELDEAIDAFYATLSPDFARRVTIMSFSEFGRRGRANGSLGTDHGNSSNLLLVGDNVKGGLYGQAPDLNDLDGRGDPLTHVDFRSVYATVLGGWLGADPVQILGGAFEDLDLFKGRPGEVVTGPVTTGPWVPFATAADLIRQQYRDFLGREGDEPGVAYWASRLERRVNSISEVILRFLDSPEFGRTMAPVARLALTVLQDTPEYADLQSWSASSRGGTPLADIAREAMGKPGYTDGYGTLDDRAFVDIAYRDIAGRAPSSSARASWVDRLDAGTHDRADLFVALCGTADAERRFEARVNVLMTYAGLLLRRPDPGGWEFWVGRVERGTSVGGLVAQFFTSSEYRRRFDGD